MGAEAHCATIQVCVGPTFARIRLGSNDPAPERVVARRCRL